MADDDPRRLTERRSQQIATGDHQGPEPPAAAQTSGRRSILPVTGYTAGPGWDPVTGWGSPDAQYLIPLLAHMARSDA